MIAGVRSPITWALLVSALAWSSGAASAQTVDVTGELQNRPGKVLGTFAGTFELVKFVVEDDELIAEGVLNGVVKNRAGKTVREITDRVVQIPVEDLDVIDNPETEGTCDILHLELGPLDLNLLGLIVHLDQVVLDIDADPEGGLLGDLLCDLADGLDLGLDLDVITGLLNQVLNALDL